MASITEWTIWNLKVSHWKRVRYQGKKQWYFDNIISNGSTPLSIASYYGNLKVVKYLIEKGADIESMDNDNFINNISKW